MTCQMKITFKRKQIKLKIRWMAFHGMKVLFKTKIHLKLLNRKIFIQRMLWRALATKRCLKMPLNRKE